MVRVLGSDKIDYVNLIRFNVLFSRKKLGIIFLLSRVTVFSSIYIVFSGVVR